MLANLEKAFPIPQKSSTNTGTNYNILHNLESITLRMSLKDREAWWLSGRVIGTGLRGCGFYLNYCNKLNIINSVVSLDLIHIHVHVLIKRFII